jgi:hypothetical protein
MNGLMTKEFFEHWRNSKRLYFEYQPPAQCNGQKCGSSSAPGQFYHAHIAISGEDPNTQIDYVALDQDMRGAIGDVGPVEP